MQAQRLGDKWYQVYYPKICDSLGFVQARDEKSRDLLSELLSAKKIIAPEAISLSIRNRGVVMFGAGPSLDSDLDGLISFIMATSPTIVAADGAADALYSLGIKPAIIVSDLDSCSLENLNRSSEEGYVFAHAHGDNLDLVEKIIPKLGIRVFGTTQVSSVGNVVNFGGLTDGDRACYIACCFKPRTVIIAGMDFGSKEGEHSKNKYHAEPNPSRPSKLAWGKASLEFLIRSSPHIRFLNVTKNGEEISGAPKVSYDNLTLDAS